MYMYIGTGQEVPDNYDTCIKDDDFQVEIQHASKKSRIIEQSDSSAEVHLHVHVWHWYMNI